jgi:2'-5' RNA ligase
MDSELKIFLQSFKELENLFQALPISGDQIQELKSHVSGILKNAKNLALYDTITHALNTRAGKWLIPTEQIKGMAKADIYDLRQANKVYGALVVDSELRKLAYQFMSIFSLDTGDFVRRSPGSDEFRIFSTTKTPSEIKKLISKPYIRQETDSLLTWDYGVGFTETEAENELQKQRKKFRPMVIRQTIIESHSEIPRRIEENDSYQSWNEFNMPYENLMDKIYALKMPAKLKQQAIVQVQITQNIVESIVTKEYLTGSLNGLGVKWYLENKPVHGVALTDMLNMHEGNTRYGSSAIDQDLKRFSNVLAKYFPKKDGFLIFRSERAGDEFKIASTENDIAELENRIHIVWQNDLHHGLLAWNYGVGRNDVEAHTDLYRNRLKEIESMETSAINGRSTFIVVRPESEAYSSLYKLSDETARATDGTPIIDLHLTVQAIRNVDDFDSLKKRLEEYAQTIPPFEIMVKNIARMNVNNQQGRLWLMAEKNTALEDLYNGLGKIACEMGYESYPYKSQNWLPHIKIVDLPEDRSTRIKDSTFDIRDGITFTVNRLEWTVQTEREHWELLTQFPFPEK